MKNYRLHWDSELGWIVDTDVTLSDSQLSRICEWALPKQIDRWNSLPIGSKKDELKMAIKLLQNKKIRQKLINERNGTSTLFKATTGTGKIISIGGF